MNEPFMSDTIKRIYANLEEIIRQEMEYKERTLAEIITKYDFIVGSNECKRRLMEILPDGANVICSPYIENPTMIYAIKKFDITDLLFDKKEDQAYSFPEVFGEPIEMLIDGVWVQGKVINDYRSKHGNSRW